MERAPLAATGTFLVNNCNSQTTIDSILTEPFECTQMAQVAGEVDQEDTPLGAIATTIRDWLQWRPQAKCWLPQNKTLVAQFTLTVSLAGIRSDGELDWQNEPP